MHRELAPDADIRDALARGQYDHAFRLLHVRYRSLIHRHARWMVDDAALAEDVAQEVFIRIHRALPTVRPDTSLRAWVMAVARHRSLDELRKQGRRRRFVRDGAVPEPIDDARPPSEVLHMCACRRTLALALARMPERTQRAVLLRYGDELTFEQIAVLLDERPDTVRMRVSRALPRLRLLTHSQERVRMAG